MEIGAELVDERRHLRSLVLRDGALKSRNSSRRGLGIGDNVENPKDVENPLADGDGVTAERMLDDILHGERRGSLDLFQLGHCLPLVHLAQWLEVEAVLFFEDRLETLGEPSGTLGRVGQASHHFLEFPDRRDAHFVPVEVELLESSEGLVGRLG